MPIGLTPKQAEVMVLIQKYNDAHGLSPTVRELATMRGKRSHGCTQFIVAALQERGHIRRTRGPRSIVILERVTESDEVPIVGLFDPTSAQLSECLEARLRYAETGFA